MPTWSEIELLNAIMDSGTLTGAGRMLQIDQTTAARRLSRLEKRLGGKLFDRYDGKLNPTALLLQAEQAILNMSDASQAAESILSNAKVELAGRVTVSCLGFHATEVLAPNLTTLLQLHPKIVLDIACENRSVSFDRREADIAIRFAWPEESSAVMRRLASIKFRRYAAMDIAPHDTRIVRYTDALSHLPEMQLLSSLRPEAIAFLRSDRLDLLAAAAENIGAEVMLPEWMGDRSSNLARVDDDSVFAERPIFLLTHPARRKAPSVVAVKDWLYGLHMHNSRQ